MADSIYTFDPVAANNTALDTIPYGPNQLYHNQIDNWFRALGSKLAQFVDDLGAANTVAGTGDAITVALSSGISAYATGQLFRFIAGAANTGAATMNVNSIGAKAIRKISGGTDVALAAGDIAAGETYLVIYREAANAAAGAWVLVGGAASTIPYTAASASGAASLQFAEDTDNGTNKVTLQGPASTADVTVTLPSSAGTLALAADVPTAATQANQESAASTTTYVSPGRQQYHPSASKAWCYVSRVGGTPTLGALDYGVASVTDDGAAQTIITFDTAMSGTTYIPWVSPTNDASSNNICAVWHTRATGSFKVVLTTGGGAAMDDTSFSAGVFGDQ